MAQITSGKIKTTKSKLGKVPVLMYAGVFAVLGVALLALSSANAGQQATLWNFSGVQDTGTYYQGFNTNTGIDNATQPNDYTDPDYAGGTFYMRVEVADKKTDLPVRGRLCFWRFAEGATNFSDSNFEETCGGGNELQFVEDGVYWIKMDNPGGWWQKNGAYDWAQPHDVGRIMFFDMASNKLLMNSNCGGACFEGDASPHLPLSVTSRLEMVAADGEFTAPAEWTSECPSAWGGGCTVVDSEAPTIAVVTPVENATLTGDAVELLVTAHDNVLVEKVEFYIDGELVTEDIVPSNNNAQFAANFYSTVINTTLLKNGGHTVSMKAIDSSGNETTTSEIAITTNNPDVEAPIVTIAAPADNETVSGIITVVADIRDREEVVSAEVAVNEGSPIVASLNSDGQYVADINLTAYPDNVEQMITVRATDNSGNVGASETITVTVDNSGSDDGAGDDGNDGGGDTGDDNTDTGDNTGTGDDNGSDDDTTGGDDTTGTTPSITFTLRDDGTQSNVIAFDATATNTNALQRVELRNEATSEVIIQDDESPYELSVPYDYPNGTHQLRAVAIEADDTELSAADTITVEIRNPDITRDQQVDLSDILKIILNWRSTVSDTPAADEFDLDGNGEINLSDILQVIVNWSR